MMTYTLQPWALRGLRVQDRETQAQYDNSIARTVERHTESGYYAGTAATVLDLQVQLLEKIQRTMTLEERERLEQALGSLRAVRDELIHIQWNYTIEKK